MWPSAHSTSPAIQRRSPSPMAADTVPLRLAAPRAGAGRRGGRGRPPQQAGRSPAGPRLGGGGGPPPASPAPSVGGPLGRGHSPVPPATPQAFDDGDFDHPAFGPAPRQNRDEV